MQTFEILKWVKTNTYNGMKNLIILLVNYFWTNDVDKCLYARFENIGRVCL